MISVRAEIRFRERGTDRGGTADRAEEDQLEPCAAVLAGRGGVAPARPVAVLVQHSAGENEPVWSFVGCEDVSARSDNSSGYHGASGRKGDAIEAAHFMSRFLRSAAVCSSPVAWSKNTNWPSSRFTVRPAGTGKWTLGRSARLKAARARHKLLGSRRAELVDSRFLPAALGAVGREEFPRSEKPWSRREKRRETE